MWPNLQAFNKKKNNENTANLVKCLPKKHMRHSLFLLDGPKIQFYGLGLIVCNN